MKTLNKSEIEVIINNISGKKIIKSAMSDGETFTSKYVPPDMFIFVRHINPVVECVISGL